MSDFWRLINKVYDPDYLDSAVKTKASIIEKVFDSISFRPNTVYMTTYNPIADVLAEVYDLYLPASEIGRAHV